MERSPSPDIPPEQDFSAWFAPLPEDVLGSTAALFAPASALPAKSSLFAPAAAMHIAADDFAPSSSSQALQSAPITGFMRASNKGFLAPSAAALEEAKKKIQAWQDDPIHTDPAALVTENQSQENASNRAPQLPRNVADSSFASFDSLAKMPETPTPAGAGLGRETTGNILLPAFSTPSAGLGGARQKPKAFKSPLLKNKPSHSSVTAFTSSPLNPKHSNGFGFTSASSQHTHPLAASPTNANMTPVRPTTNTPLAGSSAGAAFVTPMRPLSGTKPHSAIRSTPARFNTPFKPGMRPGEAGRVALENASERQAKEIVLTQHVVVPGAIRGVLTANKGKARAKYFDLGKF